jgi:hypothetical protein
MQVKDLRREPPRRWNEALEGVSWLPRLIDKTRAALVGTLGAYLYGQSPMDRALLQILGLNHRTFAEIVAAAPDDRAVVAALEAHDSQCLERARAWSATLPEKHASFLRMMDIDDGYVAGGAQKFKPLANGISFVLTWVLKRLYPTRALEGLERKW